MTDDSLGLDLKPGDEHYRAYVGPPGDYDLISAMVFNLLTVLGLRQHQRVLDVGCGSLRIGRLLIPYLNKGNYVGIEPNKWLMDDGIKHEIGRDQIDIKTPLLLEGASADVLEDGEMFDFAFAQSIFSHCGLDLIAQWLRGVSLHLKEDGVFAATFIKGDKDFDGAGWIYPGCVPFTPETLEKLAGDLGYGFKELDWWHPRQTWCLFYKKDFDVSWIPEHSLSWNDAKAPKVDVDIPELNQLKPSLLGRLFGK